MAECHLKHADLLPPDGGCAGENEEKLKTFDFSAKISFNSLNQDKPQKKMTTCLMRNIYFLVA